MNMNHYETKPDCDHCIHHTYITDKQGGIFLWCKQDNSETSVDNLCCSVYNNPQVKDFIPPAL